MVKKIQSNKHNLNKKKGTRLILLILALTFVIVPLLTLIIYVSAL